MKNTRAVVMLLIAVLLGLVAVGLAVQWLGGGVTGQKVVVAERDIQPGTPLGQEMASVIEWPAATTPAGSFSNPSEVNGRVLKSQVARGEPILESKLAPIGARGGLSSIISEGKRAITVRVNEIIGVAGFALPGNYVDIMVNANDEQQKPVSKIVLEKILVLAVAQEASRDETKPKVVNAVTMEVTPEQAELLDLARSIGNLSLVLRNQSDVKTIATDGARRQDLLALKESLEKPAPASVAVRRVRTKARPVRKAETEKIEVIKGLDRSEVEFKK